MGEAPIVVREAALVNLAGRGQLVEAFEQKASWASTSFL